MSDVYIYLCDHDRAARSAWVDRPSPRTFVPIVRLATMAFEMSDSQQTTLHFHALDDGGDSVVDTNALTWSSDSPLLTLTPGMTAPPLPAVPVADPLACGAITQNGIPAGIVNVTGTDGTITNVFQITITTGAPKTAQILADPPTSRLAPPSVVVTPPAIPPAPGP